MLEHPWHPKVSRGIMEMGILVEISYKQPSSSRAASHLLNPRTESILGHDISVLTPGQSQKTVMPGHSIFHLLTMSLKSLDYTARRDMENSTAHQGLAFM
jgi:hypothetical protein